MAARAIWKGVVRFDGTAVPVKLYSAIEDRGVHFRLLHESDRVPLRQKMVDPETGEGVAGEDVRRGFTTEDGTVVVLEGEELDALEPEPSRDIEVTRCVPMGAIDHPWYDRPYWLGPDGDDRAYFALADALRAEDREAVVRWTMRKKEYQGAIRPRGEHLILLTLRHAEEVVPAAALEPPGGRALDERELGMAEQLIDALRDDFDPSRYHDEYRERVLELVARKAAGEEVEVVELAPRVETREESLAGVLEESLRAARERRTA